MEISVYDDIFLSDVTGIAPVVFDTVALSDPEDNGDWIDITESITVEKLIADCEWSVWDTLTLSEYVFGVKEALDLSVFDDLALSEYPRAQPDVLLVNIPEAVTVTDSLTLWYHLEQALSDIVTMGDPEDNGDWVDLDEFVQVYAGITPVEIDVYEDISISEDIAEAIDPYLISVFDTIALSDFAAPSGDWLICGGIDVLILSDQAPGILYDLLCGVYEGEGVPEWGILIE